MRITDYRLDGENEHVGSLACCNAGVIECLGLARLVRFPFLRTTYPGD